LDPESHKEDPDGRCNHLKNVVSTSELAAGGLQQYYPKESFSITVVAVGTDVPKYLLDSFQKAMETLQSVLYVASLERGDKQNHLHLQAAAEIRWDRNNVPALVKHLKDLLQLKEIALQFKVQCKLFETGQSWLGMIGYCQKSRDNCRDYRLIHK